MKWRTSARLDQSIIVVVPSGGGALRRGATRHPGMGNPRHADQYATRTLATVCEPWEDDNSESPED